MLTKEQASQVADDLLRAQAERQRFERNLKARSIPKTFRFPAMYNLEPFEREELVKDAKRAVMTRIWFVVGAAAWSVLWLSLYWTLWRDQIVGTWRIAFVAFIILPIRLCQVMLIRREVWNRLQAITSRAAAK